MLQFECPACKAKIQAGDEHAGQQTVCPACNRPVSIPARAGNTPVTGIAKPEHAEQVKVTASASADGAYSEGLPPVLHQPPPIPVEHPYALRHGVMAVMMVLTLLALYWFLVYVCNSAGIY